MAYNFVAASTQYLSANAPVTTTPVTTFARFNRTTGGNHTLINLAVPTTAAVLSLMYNAQQSNQLYVFSKSSGGGFAQATLSIAVAANTWHTQTATVASNTSRTTWFNGSGNSATNTTNIAGGTPTELAIGAYRTNNTTSLFLDGTLADVAVWSVSLTDAEIDALHKGFKPTRIRPQSLAFYAPLIRDLQDLRGALTITNNNTATVADHPRVY
jgi:hypothetical protein